jgi:hypothetical protein
MKADKQRSSVARRKPRPEHQSFADSKSKQVSEGTTVPKGLRRSGRVVAAVLFLLLGLGGCFAALEALGIYTPPESTDQMTESAESSKLSTSMPRIIGKNYAQAIELLNEICDESQCEYFDLYSDRSVWIESNWTVIDQAPPAGYLVDDTAFVCIGIVKNDELSFERTYDFPAECPKSDSEAVDERAKKWIPDGYEEFSDGFAFNKNYRESVEECEFEGITGRCAHYQFVTRDGFINGVFVTVQWLNSLDQVVDVSLFTTSGSVGPGGKFEFFAFLSNSTWDKPVSPRIIGISG